KILVPYDGSKQSDKALKKTIELTELIDKGGTRIEINVLHVVAEIYVPPTLFDRDVNVKSKITGERLTSEQYLKEFYHKMKSKAMKMLETKKSNELESPNIMIRNYVIHGYPSDKILEFAKHQVNLIVIGSIGLTGFSRIKALGSVVRSISERANCPGMLVR
ncbi:MAG: universal stress protein, partial [Nitrososphaeraceae archaeon]